MIQKLNLLLLLLKPTVKLFLGHQKLPDLALRVDYLFITLPSFPLWPACRTFCVILNRAFLLG